MTPGERFDALLEKWKAEGEITATTINTCMTDQMRLYASYKAEYKDATHLLRKTENKVNALKRDKFRYYSGTMTADEMDAKGWAYDPFNGALKPQTIKAKQEYVDLDPEIQEAEAELSDAKLFKELCEDILNQIRFRAQTATATMETIKFSLGV